MFIIPIVYTLYELNKNSTTTTTNNDSAQRQSQSQSQRELINSEKEGGYEENSMSNPLLININQDILEINNDY